MHLFRVAELEGLLEDAALCVETISGLESILSQRRDEFDKLTDVHRDTIRDAVRELREDRLAADLSGHILAIARVYIHVMWFDNRVILLHPASSSFHWITHRRYGDSELADNQHFWYYRPTSRLHIWFPWTARHNGSLAANCGGSGRGV